MRSPAKNTIVLDDGGAIDDREISNGSVGVNDGIRHHNRSDADLRRSGNYRAWMDKRGKGEANVPQTISYAATQPIVPNRNRYRVCAAGEHLWRQIITAYYTNTVTDVPNGSGIKRRNGFEAGRPSHVDDDFGMPASTNYQEVHNLPFIAHIIDRSGLTVQAAANGRVARS